MGCDIHIFVERKEGNKWVVVKGINPLIEFYQNLMQKPLYSRNKQYYLEQLKYVRTYKPKVYENWIYSDRNYQLFAILANVRNNFNIIPIDYPRGLPKDISNVVFEEYKSYGISTHSASYFTLRELLEFDWDGNYYKEDEQVLSYRDIAGEFLENIEKYIKDSNITDLDSVRIVFWFDS